MTETDEARLFPAIVKGSLALLVVATISAFLITDLNMAFGILAGGAVAIVNFIWQRSVLRRILGLASSKPQMYLQVRYVLRLVITGILLYVLIKFTTVSIFGLLIGLSVIVINITLLSIYFAVRKGD